MAHASLLLSQSVQEARQISRQPNTSLMFHGFYYIYNVTTFAENKKKNDCPSQRMLANNTPTTTLHSFRVENLSN
jgi:hypothetical protein